MYKRILVAVDGTATSLRALREAVDLAADQRAELEIVHVVNLEPYGAPVLGVPVNVYEEVCRAQGRQILRQATEYAQRAGVEARATLRQRRGHAPQRGHRGRDTALRGRPRRAGRRQPPRTDAA